MYQKLFYGLIVLSISLMLTACNVEQTNTDVEKEQIELEYKDFGNAPFVFNIEDYTVHNETYRTALWTGEFMQLTVMNILPGEDIGLEIHDDHDQFIRVEQGEGLVLMGDAADDLSFQEVVKDDYAIMIPAGKWHNVVNTSDEPLKLYSIYAPAEHPKGTVHQTQEEALADEYEH